MATPRADTGEHKLTGITQEFMPLANRGLANRGLGLRIDRSGFD